MQKPSIGLSGLAPKFTRMDLGVQIAGFPKIELHCHLLGVISPTLLRQINEAEAALVNSHVLRQVLPINNTVDFQRVVDTLLPYQRATWQAYRPILAYHIQELIRQNVIYTELMISPLMFPQQIDKMLSSFQTFRQWINGLEQGRLQVEFLLVLPRNLDSKKVAKNVRQYIALYEAGLIVGVAVVGLENGTSIKRLLPALQQLKAAGLGIEIHAGEHSGPEDVREALELGGADRIGHGISLFQDPELVRQVAGRQVHFEFCLTSNLRTGSIAQLGEHPLPLAKQADIPFSLNTDDPGLFACSLNEEYLLAAKHWHLTQADFELMFTNTLKARFQAVLRYPDAFPDWCHG